MTRLIYSGIFDELPTLKIVSHHMGGMIPYFAGKIKLGFRQIFFGTTESNPVAQEAGLKKPPLDYFKMLYADTALGEVAPTQLRPRLLRHRALPVRHRRAVRRRAGPRADRQHACARSRRWRFPQAENATRSSAGNAKRAAASLLSGSAGHGDANANRKHQGEAARRRDGRLRRLSRPHAGRRHHRHHGDLGRQRHHARARARVRRGGLRLPGAGPVLAAGAGRRALRPAIPRT